MTVRVYTSSDAGMPGLLVNTAGSLISVLDACLVNGYGSKQAAGWSKVFSATGVAVYRAPQGNRFYLRVDDNQSANFFYFARVIGYESMTDVDTGTGLFPSAAQLSGGVYWGKNESNLVGQGWQVVATETCFFLHSFTTQGTTNFFGDFPSYKAGDAYNTLIIGWNSTSNSRDSSSFQLINRVNTATTGHFIARSYTQLGASVTASKMSEAHRMGDSGVLGAPANSAAPLFPNPVSGTLDLARIYIGESSASVLRGQMPGAWNILHTQSGFAVGDTFTGSGELAGKTFQVFQSNNYSTAGRWALEISNTW